MHHHRESSAYMCGYMCCDYLTPLAHRLAVSGDTGKPLSASSIAGFKTAARLNLPHRLMVSHQPAHAPMDPHSYHIRTRLLQGQASDDMILIIMYQVQ